MSLAGRIPKAAPYELFALGIVLPIRIDKNQLKLGLVVSFLRLVVHPLVAFIIIILVGGYGYEVDTARTTLMVAAAPVGLMAFTFSPKYKV